MPVASCLSMHLARFPMLRVAGPLVCADGDRPMFAAVAADIRAAGTEPASQQAFAFLVLALHADEAAAHDWFDARRQSCPWLAEATETWSAVLAPFRHKGCANYLDPDTPGPLFAVPSSPVPSDGPLVSITSSGWVLGAGLNMDRVREFSNGVSAVRTSMTGIPGLHSQQSFFFPGVLALDPVTVSFWRNDAAIRAFAYEQGSHRRQLDRQNAERMADRTSFTRCRVVRSEGTWYGTDPQAW